MNKDIHLSQELATARTLLDWMTDEDIGLLIEAALDGWAASNSDGKPGWAETVFALDEHLRDAGAGKPIDRASFRRDAARLAEIAEQAITGTGLAGLLAHDWPASLDSRRAQSAAQRMGADSLIRLSAIMRAARGPDNNPPLADRRRPVP